MEMEYDSELSITTAVIVGKNYGMLIYVKYSVHRYETPLYICNVELILKMAKFEHDK